MSSVPAIGTILLGTRDPERLRSWYKRAFGVTADPFDRFLRFGEVGVLIDSRPDVAASTAEPGRVILNLHVPDAPAVARHLDAAMNVTWVAPLEYRERPGAWFGTVADPDGNYVQIIELTEAYHAMRAAASAEA